MPDTPEQERLKRLRESQIKDRDPLVKTRAFNKQVAIKGRRLKQSDSLGQMWTAIPHVWKGVLYGFIAGVLAAAVIPKYWVSTYTFPCIGGGTLITTVILVVIGRALDARDEIKRVM